MLELSEQLHGARFPIDYLDRPYCHQFHAKCHCGWESEKQWDVDRLGNRIDAHAKCKLLVAAHVRSEATYAMLTEQLQHYLSPKELKQHTLVYVRTGIDMPGWYYLGCSCGWHTPDPVKIKDKHMPPYSLRGVTRLRKLFNSHRYGVLDNER